MTAFFILLQHLLPQHLLSRLAGVIASARTVWFKNLLISRFIRTYGVNMDDALQSDWRTFDCFNSFFTRELKAGIRPLPESSNRIVSPADGNISALGNIEHDSIFQAKGKAFSLKALLGGNAVHAAAFRNGNFATVYLSPKDYHRVHMPYTGTLQELIYVPGKLFSVNQATAENIDNLFARNERAVCIFSTDIGPMAVVLVGAMIVAGIETVFSGQVAPAAHGLQTTSFADQADPVRLERGAELGRFKLGSTAIVLFAPGVMQWANEMKNGAMVRMGQDMGTTAPQVTAQN